MLITSKLKIDLRQPGFKQIAYAVQNDSNTRALEISLFLESTPWKIPSGTTAAVSFRKMDLTSGLYDILPDGSTKAVTFSENVLTAILAPQVLTCAGKVDLSIALYDSSLNRLGVFPILLYVSTDPSAGKSISNNYYYLSTLAAVNEAIGNLNDLKTVTKESLVAAINEVAQGSGSVLTTEQINALDNMFKVCAFTKADVSAEYHSFCTAFGIGNGTVPDEPDSPAVTLTSISATYSGGPVPAGTAVSALSGIVVTAHYSNGSTASVGGYILSGTIKEGSNIITVTYQGKTATFTVTGVAESGGDEETTTPFGVEWTEGYMLLNGEPYTNANYVASDYIDVSGKTEIRIHYDGTGNKTINFQIEAYDTAKGRLKDYYVNTYLKSESDTQYPSPLVYPIQTGTAYVRMATSIKNGSVNAGYVYYTDLTYELI